MTENSVSKLTQLCECAHKTQLALVNDWYTHNQFRDKNHLKEGGLLSEGIGLAGVVLMLIAFRDEESVFSAEEKQKAKELIYASLGNMCKWSEKSFGADPLLTGKEAKFFTKDFGYVDTITYCLSVSVLIRYAERKGELSLDEQLKDSVYSMMARSAEALLSSQHDNGTWGFATDKKSKDSLFFTYSVSCAVADFFDYIMGEIDAVEQKASGVDKEMLAILDKTLGNTQERFAVARQKLREFLVRECLPLLPRLANCETLENAMLERLGISTNVSYQSYHQLYFTYYLLDAMNISGADLYFAEIAENKDAVEELKTHYTDNNLIPEAEKEYVFKDENFAKMYESFYEQALHSSRVQYINASRTGKKFWDSTKSELSIPWEHEDANITADAEDALKKSFHSFTDPTIIPLALRANTTYAYYVTQKPDLTVERLFESIKDSAFIKGQSDEENEEYCVENLWDDQYYNLSITEKSIEAIIDFYDYLRAFESKEAAPTNVTVQSVPAPMPQKSALDMAVEQKIESYLSSKEGKELLAAAIGEGDVRVAAPATSTAATALELNEQLLDLINDLTDLVKSTNKLNRDGLIYERAAAALYDLAHALNACVLKQTLFEVTKQKSDETCTEYEKRMDEHATELEKRTKKLMFQLDADINDERWDFSRLYDRIKQQNQ